MLIQTECGALFHLFLLSFFITTILYLGSTNFIFNFNEWQQLQSVG